MLTTKIRKVGNSEATIIPKPLMQLLEWTSEDTLRVELTEDRKGLVLRRCDGDD